MGIILSKYTDTPGVLLQTFPAPLQIRVLQSWRFPGNGGNRHPPGAPAGAGVNGRGCYTTGVSQSSMAVTPPSFQVHSIFW